MFILYKLLSTTSCQSGISCTDISDNFSIFSNFDDKCICEQYLYYNPKFVLERTIHVKTTPNYNVCTFVQTHKKNKVYATPNFDIPATIVLI